MFKPQWHWLAALFFCTSVTGADLNWEAALNGEHRSESNRARDEYRHPQETLSFFGLAAGMTVLEVSPGGGWYTEGLALLTQGPSEENPSSANRMEILELG